MFLATTALSEFWDKGQEILFLGSWCTRYDRQEDWQILKFRIMPSPWDDPDEFHKACRYLEGSYDRLLAQFVDYLNAVHEVSLERRYWRIVVGPWLLWYLHMSYDRYVHLEHALRLDPHLQTYVLDSTQYRKPHDMPEFVEYFIGDRFNLQMYSEILEGMGYAFPVRTLDSSALPDNPVSGSGKLRKRLSTLKSSAQRLSTSSMNSLRSWEVGLFGMGWSRKMEWQLAQRTLMKAMPMDLPARTKCPKTEGLAEARRGFGELPATDDFERIFLRTVPSQFPAHYLECFAGARNHVRRTVRHFPRVLVSSMGWKFNESFKFAAAEAMLDKSRLITTQHGGGYGMLRYLPTEHEEAAVADKYLVWGWADGKFPMTNVPGPKLSEINAKTGQRERIARGEDIVLVTTDHPRYLFFFYSVPVGSQWEQYADWQSRFIGTLPAELQKALTYRPYGTEFHALGKRVKAEFSTVKVDGAPPITDVLSNSRIVVIDHAMTTMLEALVANVPTVMFWDRRLWETREEAEPCMEELRNVGALWHSPEEAAKKVAKIYDDPWAWWGREEVQAARNRFVERYAFARDDWASVWADVLIEQVAIQRGTTRQHHDSIGVSD